MRAEPPPGPRAGRGPLRRAEGGSASYELVLLLPVLMLMVLFVLWAGRTGQARLAADLAAEEALAAAAMCCDPDDTERREQVVEALLAQRPELAFLCIDEPRPLDDSERFVSERELYFDDSGGGAIGVGVLGLGFGCTTDAAVGVLGGVLPPTEIRARAAEVVMLEPRPGGYTNIRPTLRIRDATANERFGSIVFQLVLDEPAGDDLWVWYRTLPFDPNSAAVVNARARLADDEPGFGYCDDDIDREGPSYDPGSFVGRHWDYQAAFGLVRFTPGESTETIAVSVYDDCLYEGDERFRIELFGENEATVIVERRKAVGTITSEDERPTLQFADVTAEVSEQSGGTTVTPPLELVNSAGRAIISGIRVSGRLMVDALESTASQGSDPSGDCPADFALRDAGFSIEAAMTAAPSRLPSVFVDDDGVYEGAETIGLAIGPDPNNADLATESSSMVITIQDDEEKPAALLVDPDSSDDPVGDREVTANSEGTNVALEVRLIDTDGNEVFSGRPWRFEFEVDDPPSPVPPASYRPAVRDDFTLPGGGTANVSGCTAKWSGLLRIEADGEAEPWEERAVVSLTMPPGDPVVDFTSGSTAGSLGLTVIIPPN